MRSRTGRWSAIVAVLALLWPGIASAGSLAEADQLYRTGRYAEAADRLTGLTLENPGDASLYERLGAARYRAGDFEGAARAWDQAERLGGGSGVDSLYNSGNAHYQAGRLEEALDRYERALEADPGHQRTQQNLELLKQELAARQVEPPPPPPQPQEGGEGDESDPSEGDESESQPPADGESGESGTDQEPQEGENEQQGMAGEQGEPEDEGDGQAGLDDLEPADGEADPSEDGQEGGGGYEETGPITEGEAHRLLDGLEEGNHRVRVSGRGGEKPW